MHPQGVVGRKSPVETKLGSWPSPYHEHCEADVQEALPMILRNWKRCPRRSKQGPGAVLTRDGMSRQPRDVGGVGECGRCFGKLLGGLGRSRTRSEMIGSSLQSGKTLGDCGLILPRSELYS